jgi:hypothetical protein
MSASQRLISAFIVFHLIATVIGAIPAPDSILPAGSSNRTALSATRIAAATVLDSAVNPLLQLETALWHGTRWFRRPVRLYLSATRQYQRWNMFSRPLRRDDYVHLRYYVQVERSSLLRVHRELVYPAHTDEIFSFVNCCSGSFRDKAIGLSLESHFHRVARELRRGRTDQEAYGRAEEVLAQVVKPFARRYAERGLAPGERLVRADFWRGSTRTPPPGIVVPADMLEARKHALEGYDAVTDLGLLTVSNLPEILSVSRDADIEWILLAQVTWK